ALGERNGAADSAGRDRRGVSRIRDTGLAELSDALARSTVSQWRTIERVALRAGWADSDLEPSSFRLVAVDSGHYVATFKLATGELLSLEPGTLCLVVQEPVGDKLRLRVYEPTGDLVSESFQPLDPAEAARCN